MDQRRADRLVAVESSKRAGQVWRRRFWIQGVHIEFHFSLEWRCTGYLDEDRALDHKGTVARAGGDVEGGFPHLR